MVLNAQPALPPPAALERAPADRANPVPAPRILVVDDDPVAAQAIAELLGHERYATAIAHDGEAALAMLDQPPPAEGDDPAEPGAGFGLLITDLNMPRLDGLGLLRRVRRQHRAVVPIVVTGYGRIDAAVEAVRLGAIDFLTKPIVADDLKLAVRKAVHQHTLLSENDALRGRLRRHEGIGTLIGQDRRMQRVFQLIDAAAATNRPMLITGPAGTGKKTAAHAIHRRAASLAAAAGDTTGPMIRFEFDGTGEAAKTAALFGQRGGARAAKPGAIAEAEGGTLVIEQLERAAPGQQALLWRLIDQQTYTRVGEDAARPCRCRVILITAADLPSLAEQGALREDLCVRLNVGAIALPPLRERRGDVRLLAEHFIEQQSAELRKPRRLGDAALRALERYAFPGNVRELEQAIAHAVMVSDRAVIAPDDLPEPIAPPVAQVELPDPGQPADTRVNSPRGAGRVSIPALLGDDGWTPTPLDEALKPCEKQILLAALHANGWNRCQTARQLDINRVTLYKKIRAYRLDEPGQGDHT